jgi:CRP/FNR family transcriptional regulator
MSRIDIGSYLGLTIETVSRSLSRFQEKGIISVRQRELSILQMAKLKALSGL